MASADFSVTLDTEVSHGKSNIFLINQQDLLRTIYVRFGRSILMYSYPRTQPVNPVSVRLIHLLLHASFRFFLTKDTLAFHYTLPPTLALGTFTH